MPTAYDCYLQRMLARAARSLVIALAIPGGAGSRSDDLQERSGVE